MITCALIYGFDSPEHDVSVMTALEIIRNAPSIGVRLKPIYARDGHFYGGDELTEVAAYTPFDRTAHREVLISCGKLWQIKRGKAKIECDLDVALIAAHGGEGENGGTTPSASYTSTVLAETNKTTQVKLTADSNTKLDKAVAAAAANYTFTNPGANFAIIPGTWNQVVIASDIMEGAEDYTASPDDWNFTPSTTNVDTLAGTWWTMGYVSRAMTDDYITEQVADVLDSLAEQMVDDDKVVEGATWDYTVSVAKST